MDTDIIPVYFASTSGNNIILSTNLPMSKKAIIIGAGPAGLTAAYELLKRTDIIPIILEKSGEIGGISRTTNYKGNRMDMGPHRFFSKSDRVMDWWLMMMPLEETAAKEQTISYQNKSRAINTDHTFPKDPEKTMIVIQRLTRIYFLRKFFSYPIQLSIDTLRMLGLIRTIKIMFSFLWIRLFPRKPEKSLEDFIINKFGRQLYLLFFKDYTEKVWGVTPDKISAEWGAQRIKGVSLSKAIAGAIKSLKAKKNRDITQKDKETSLIEQFLYPKHGPGSLWEEVARQVQEMGGKIYHHQDVTQIYSADGKIQCVNTINSQTGHSGAWEGDYFFSTMPVKELISGMGQDVPKEVQEVAAGLQYRDFINVGILLKQLSTKEGKKLELKDNWIYIQERDVKVGRLMIYNNWGTGMIKDPNTTWIGMEYFCNMTDDFWALDDTTIQAAAIRELEKMDLARTEDVLDITVRRMEKTYPAYFGTYDQFDKIKAFTDPYSNLFLVGRNGMHKYNNADHSMLTAMVAVDNIAAGIETKENIWSINTEQEYHEEKPGIDEKTVPVHNKGAQKAAMPASFKDYLLKDKQQVRFLWIAGIAVLLQFIIFKILYPYAGFIDGDSYVYIESATYNFSINTYPIGYSKFLRLLSTFTTSDTVLVALQYLMIQVSALYFAFTIFFHYSPGKICKWLIFSLIVFNPVFLYLSNYVSSDSLFIGLSLTWFTLLIWILRRPSIRVITWQVIVLSLAFMVRYNALYYPIIAGVVLLLSRQPLRWKLAGITASIAVVMAFVLFTAGRYKEVAGIRSFSPFSGWQIANNAMYAYRFVGNKDLKTAPPRLEALDQIVRHYFDTTKDMKKHPEEMLIASTVYMWDPHSPLQKYMTNQYRHDSTTVMLKRWASMAPLYADYGAWIIRQYPLTFFKYYLWPNSIKYYAPPSEFLETYNSNEDSVHPAGQQWFKWKSRKVTTAFKDNKVAILDYAPILAGITNAAFLIGLFCVCFLKGLKYNSKLSPTLYLLGLLWLINFAFSVFAAPITYRYQLFGILIFSSFAFLLIDMVCKEAFSKTDTQAAI